MRSSQLTPPPTHTQPNENGKICLESDVYVMENIGVCCRRAPASSKASGNHSNTTAVIKRPSADVLTIQDRAGIGSVWTESNHSYKGLIVCMLLAACNLYIFAL